MTTVFFISTTNWLHVLMTLAAMSKLTLGVSQSNGLDDNQCNYEIVESMPDKLVFNSSMSFKPKATHEALIEMLDGAKVSIRLASFYLTLSAEPQFAKNPSTRPGSQILDSLKKACKRGLDVNIILDNSGKPMSNLDEVNQLKDVGANVKFINMKKLSGSGIMHSKFMIVDNTTLYMGSSNFDWRSYTQIKEMGIRFHNCEPLSADLNKIFETYWFMSQQDQIPAQLPDNLTTSFNMTNPAVLPFGETLANVFFGSAPSQFNGVLPGPTTSMDCYL